MDILASLLGYGVPIGATLGGIGFLSGVWVGAQDIFTGTRFMLPIKEKKVIQRRKAFAEKLHNNVSQLTSTSESETNIDYKTLTLLVESLKSFYYIRAQAKGILVAIEGESKAFPKPRIEFVRSVLLWADGCSKLIYNQPPGDTDLNNDLATMNWRDGKSLLFRETEQLMLRSFKTVNDNKPDSLSSMASLASIGTGKIN